MNKTPEAILQLKPTDMGSCTVHHIHGHYYVYQVSTYWDKEKKKTIKKTGRSIGKITEADGFIPNAYGRSILKEKGKDPVAAGNEIRVLNYGAYEMFRQLDPTLEDSLRDYFPDIFREIRTIALLRLVNGVGPRLAHPYFLDSYMSVLCPDLAMSDVSVRKFVASLGRMTPVVDAFMRASILPGSKLVFDGTHFFASCRDSLSAKGYNPNRKTTPQIRIMYILDKSSGKPLFYEVLQGSSVDKTAFIDVIRASGCKNCIVLADKGFYSKKNVSALMNSELNIQYILPLQSNTAMVKPEFYADSSIRKFDGVFSYKSRSIYYKKQKVGDEGNWLYIFYDRERQSHQEAAYVEGKKDAWKDGGYTDLDSVDPRFGYFSYISNLDVAAPSVYLDYKERWDIEQLFDYLKNVLNVAPSYAHTDDSIRGWAFINHISLLYFYALVHAFRQTKYADRYSPADVIKLAMNVYMVRIGQAPVRLSAIQVRTKEILQAIEVDLELGLQRSGMDWSL